MPPRLRLIAIGWAAAVMSLRGDMGERVRNWTLAGVVTLLACLVVGTTAVFLGVDFSADVHRVFSAGSSLGTTAQGVNFFIERGIQDSAAYDFYVGVRAAAVGLLTIGTPLGVAAKIAPTANPWLVLDQQWDTVFQMGFLLQLASTGLAAGGLLLMSFDGVVGYMAAPLVSLILVGDVVIGAVALRSWRRMHEGRHNVSLSR